MLLEGCKHSLEISVPVEEVNQETERVVGSLQKKVRLPGFRPGKAPANLIRTRFQTEIRQDVVESLLPKHFRKRVEEENLRVVGTPDITEVNFNAGEPLRFKAEFEVAPDITLGEYRGVEVPYGEPAAPPEQVDKRIEEIREQKAEYVNIDPRAIEDGDYAVVSLKSLRGVDPPIEQEELMLHVGSDETLADFTANLRGAAPDEEKEFDVTYPEDYGQQRLSGKIIHFRMKVKAIRRKELPDLNDDFAQDLGDYKSFDELREAIKQSILREREHAAQEEAKSQLVEKLVDAHDFSVPEAFVERQIQTQVEQQIRALQSRGIDPTKLKLDWEKLKEAQRDKAVRDVKASLILEKVADREAIGATQDEVDKEVQRIAKQEREPVAAMRMKLEKEGILGRIASRIRTEKTLNFLFENARKEAK